MAEMKIKVGRVNPMPLETRNKNGTIAVCELHIVDSNDNVVVCHNNIWLVDRGNEGFDLSSKRYENSNNQVNPNTGKPYKDVPFVFFPETNDKGNLRKSSDRKNQSYIQLCKKIKEEADKILQERESDENQTVSAGSSSSDESLL